MQQNNYIYFLQLLIILCTTMIDGQSQPCWWDDRYNYCNAEWKLSQLQSDNLCQLSIPWTSTSYGNRSFAF